MFTGRAARPTPFGDSIFRCTFFTCRSTLLATSGGPIFRCTTKDRGERRAKGIAIPLDPRGNVLGHSDVLCANLLATVRVTRLSRAWRAPHCFHALCVLHCQGSGSAYDFMRSLRTSAHTGVAIRIPHSTHISVAERLGERIATPGDVGHWLAMTVED